MAGASQTWVIKTESRQFLPRDGMSPFVAACISSRSEPACRRFVVFRFKTRHFFFCTVLLFNRALCSLTCSLPPSPSHSFTHTHTYTCPNTHSLPLPSLSPIHCVWSFITGGSRVPRRQPRPPASRHCRAQRHNICAVAPAAASPRALPSASGARREREGGGEKGAKKGDMA